MGQKIEAKGEMKQTNCTKINLYKQWQKNNGIYLEVEQFVKETWEYKIHILFYRKRV
jgi:hypothetical protein